MAVGEHSMLIHGRPKIVDPGDVEALLINYRYRTTCILFLLELSLGLYDYRRGSNSSFRAYDWCYGMYYDVKASAVHYGVICDAST